MIYSGLIEEFSFPEMCHLLLITNRIYLERRYSNANKLKINTEFAKIYL